MTVMDRWTGDELLATVTRAAPVRDAAREVLDGVLGMLAGAYPSDEFAELKPRVVWDRVTDTIEGRRDARVVAVTSGGTIPDRGLFGVFMDRRGRHAGAARRRARRGDGLRAPGRDARRRHRPRRQQLAGRGHRARPGHGQPGARRPRQAAVLEGRRGRPADRAGTAMGAFVGESSAISPVARRPGDGRRALREQHDLDERAAENLLAYLEDEREATGALPTDKRVVVERFRDELGDWRLTLLTPFGGRVHAPWSLALEARLQERLGMEVQTIWSDDGIAIRLPEGEATLDGVEDLLFPDAEEVEDLVVGQVAELGAVRQPLPRERGPRPAPAAPPARDADAALAAAPARGRPARRGQPLRQLPDPRRDLPRVPVRRVRPAGAARDPRRRGAPRDRGPRRRDAEGEPVREQPAVRLRRGVHVRRRRAAGRAAGRGADPRPRPAPRAARPGGAARAARPEALADLELSLQALTDDRQATTRRPGPRPAAAARRPVGRRGRGTDRRGRGGRRSVAGRARGGAPRRAGPDRRRRALDRDGGRRPLPRRRSG